MAGIIRYLPNRYNISMKRRERIYTIAVHERFIITFWMWIKFLTQSHYNAFTLVSREGVRIWIKYQITYFF